jgi:hypothetical protein
MKDNIDRLGRNTENSSWVWWCRPVIPALARLRQEDWTFEDWTPQKIKNKKPKTPTLPPPKNCSNKTYQRYRIHQRHTCRLRTEFFLSCQTGCLRMCIWIPFFCKFILFWGAVQDLIRVLTAFYHLSHSTSSKFILFKILK